ncbi:Glycosyltransferase family 28 C-terminal domain containing protein [Rhypophila sp. PSN 637]
MNATGFPAAPRTGTKRPFPADDEPDHQPTQLGRHCFVTIGATAGFRQLLEEIIDDAFLRCLASFGYDTLDVQCGPDHEWFESQVARLTETYGVKIQHFAYTDDMQVHMLESRGKAGYRLPGCIVSHAGSGTILEALRYQAPLVVVPNPTLMDNHQAELAQECENQKWAIYGRLGQLAGSVRRSHRRLLSEEQAKQRHVYELTKLEITHYVKTRQEEDAELRQQAHVDRPVEMLVQDRRARLELQID